MLYSNSIFAKDYFYLCDDVLSHRLRLCGLLACKCTNSQRLMSMCSMHDYCRVEESFCLSLFRVFSGRRDRDACHQNQNHINSFCLFMVILGRLGERCLGAFLIIFNLNMLFFNERVCEWFYSGFNLARAIGTVDCLYSNAILALRVKIVHCPCSDYSASWLLQGREELLFVAIQCSFLAEGIGTHATKIKTTVVVSAHFRLYLQGLVKGVLVRS